VSAPLSDPARSMKEILPCTLVAPRSVRISCRREGKQHLRRQPSTCTDKHCYRKTYLHHRVRSAGPLVRSRGARCPLSAALLHKPHDVLWITHHLFREPLWFHRNETKCKLLSCEMCMHGTPAPQRAFWRLRERAAARQESQ